MNCPRCQHLTSFSENNPPGRSDSCDKCGFSLRSCRACKHYDPKAYNSCREPSAERVVEKEKANFCDWFKFSPGFSQNSPSKEELLAKANALFKK
jgi:hypothetical protein